VETYARRIVREHGLPALDAWHVAVAALTVPELAPGETSGFASRHKAQADVAAEFGLVLR
jgi:hypothetical protein